MSSPLAGPAARNCVDCGLPIGHERLGARPDARHCVRCESERSRVEAQPNHPPSAR